MNKINEKRVVRLNVGTIPLVGDSKSYEAQNTILVGRTGSGVQKIVDNIIMNLAIDYKPDEVNIEYYSSVGNVSPWLKESRRLPHMQNQVYNDSESDPLDVFYEDVLRVLSTLYYITSCAYDYTKPVRKSIVFLDVTKATSSGMVIDAVTTLLALAAKYPEYMNVLVFSMAGEDYVIKELAEYTSLRMATITSTGISEELLSCNIADDVHAKESHGFVWVKQNDGTHDVRYYNVPYRPESLYGKVAKFLSNSTELAEDDYMKMRREIGELDEDNIFYIITTLPEFNKKYYQDEKFKTDYKSSSLACKKLFLMSIIRDEFVTK